jgi:hypothetical protein
MKQQEGCLEALFFVFPNLIALARRFCPDWVMQADGIYNT